VVSLEFVHMGFYHPLPVSEPHAFPNIIRCKLVSSQLGSGECVWLSVGLCSKRRCHQGPLLGPHPHNMKNAFLMMGPQRIFERSRWTGGSKRQPSLSNPSMRERRQRI
jgi:hypothetical protein